VDKKDTINVDYNKIEIMKNKKKIGRPSTKIKMICQCGKEFFEYPSIIKKYSHVFCSRKCFGVWFSKKQTGKNNTCWRGGKVERICKFCGKHFFIKASEVRRGCGKFCSPKCSYAWISKNLKGEKHGNWKGGKVMVTCKICGKEFPAKPSRAKKKSCVTCSRYCQAIWINKHMKQKNTGIEIKIKNELEKRHLDYKSQVPIYIAHTLVDFVLPDKIAIYCDGDFWHNSEWAKEHGIKNKDINQDALLSLLGYKVFRLSEKKINKSAEKCIDMVMERK